MRELVANGSSLPSVFYSFLSLAVQAETSHAGFENVSWNGSYGSVNKARRKCHFAHGKLWSLWFSLWCLFCNFYIYSGLIWHIYGQLDCCTHNIVLKICISRAYLEKISPHKCKSNMHLHDHPEDKGKMTWFFCPSVQISQKTKTEEKSALKHTAIQQGCMKINIPQQFYGENWFNLFNSTQQRSSVQCVFVKLNLNSDVYCLAVTWTYYYHTL